MSIDSSFCIVPPNQREIWTNPQRFWSRDPGNCDLGCDRRNQPGQCPNGFQFINAIQSKQKKFKNLVLQNKVPPSRGRGSMSNVDGNWKKSSFYSYLSKVKSNPFYRHQTYAVQKADGTYTNPNTQFKKLEIIKFNNNPAFLTCIKSEPEEILYPPWTGPPGIPEILYPPWTGPPEIPEILYPPWTGPPGIPEILYPPWTGPPEIPEILYPPWTGPPGIP